MDFKLKLSINQEYHLSLAEIPDNWHELRFPPGIPDWTGVPTQIQNPHEIHKAAYMIY